MSVNILKISHSIVSAEAISDLVSEYYFSGDKVDCTFLLQGLNDTYLVSVGTNKYIFRLYRYSWRTHENISFEVEFLNYLETKSAPVAEFISDKNGKTLQTLKCPEGERYGLLMVCAANQELQSHSVVTGDSFNYGKSIGKLHTSAMGFNPDSVATQIDVDHLIWQPLKLVESAFPENIDDIRYLNEVAKTLVEKITALDEAGLAKSFIHGDLMGGNARVDDSGEYIFFDFDCCGYGWTAYDLAVFKWSSMLQNKQVPLWQNFVDGYQSELNISEADLAAIPLLVMARHFWIMGYTVSQIGIKGKFNYRPSSFRQDIQFFKDHESDMA